MKSDKKFLLVFFSLLIFIVSTASAQNNNSTITKVVIDAGHGGKDPGTVSGSLREKHITLAVALALGDMITKNYPEVKVTYTRSSDVYVGLFERGNIANKVGADLFISIHVNGSKSSAGNGVETFVMGISRQKSNLEVAMKENDVILYEDDYTTKYGGYEPGSSESFIIFSLMQYAYLDNSMRFANMIQSEYANNIPLAQRGVKQDGFLVLWKTAMPSVLTEIGFLSNPKDAAFLTSEEGQEKIVRSIFNAFAKYKTDIESNGKIIDAQTVSNTSTTRDTVKKTPPQKTPIEQKNDADNNNTIIYSVQIAVGSNKVDLNKPPYRQFKELIYTKPVGKNYKYLVGHEVCYKDALSLQAKVRKSFKDAFLVAFEGDKQVPIDDHKD